MKNSFLLSVLVAFAITASAQNVEVKTGKFSPEWESLDAWQCPEWFKDAKFGIWAHWGPQCQAEYGDWYARFMYYPGTNQYNYHSNTYGDPSEYGLKELCRDWKAANWNPEELIDLYKSAGAKYFVALGNHHDNFDLWNSPYQEWNSVNIGPKRDLLKGWSDACKKASLPIGVSIHASHAWTWLEASQDFDGNLTKEEGTGKWWEGMDPQELYAQRHDPSTGYDESGTIHSQWEWGNGASLPSEAYKTKFQNRVLEMINDYDPALIYFDDTAMPFYGCDDAVGKNILAHYYNHSAEKNGGTPNVVVTGKKLTDAQKQHELWDVERGIPDAIQEEYWQTCTCIGSWHYDQGIYTSGSYKSAQQVVDMLVDIVSKNGNLLLSVPVKADGTIDEKEKAIVEQIKAWMDVNSISIYGTRPWKTFGEGPLAEKSNPLSGQGFNEGNNYSAKDVRYAQRNDSLFATIMRWPASKSFSFTSLSIASKYYSGKVKSVELIGYGKVDYKESIDGVTVSLPDVKPNDIAPVFVITFGEMEQVDLALIIESYETKVKDLLLESGYDTGKYNKENVQAFSDVINAQKQYIGSSEANQKVAVETINEAYKLLKSNGRIQPGAPANEENATDMTIEKMLEKTDFAATTMGSRFGTPANWTVENYYVEENDESKGVKNGIDAYEGYNALSLGIWGSEDKQPYTCDLRNARIYRKVTLEPGRYFFGNKYNANYNLSDAAYLYVADKVLDTDDVEDASIAFAPIKNGQTGNFFGVTFTVKEEKEVVICYQADMANGATEQEFRVSEIKLLYYGNMNYDALNELYMYADQVIAESKVNSNTGYYSKAAVAVLEEAMEKALEIDESATYEEFMEAYSTLQKAIEDFKTNGRNPGAAPADGWIEDMTIEKLHEADNFKRTAETDDGDRFGIPEYWTVENFGFGDQGGIDHDPGYDCLHLEVWWNSSAFPDNGYDIQNVRLYQKVHLPEGRYFFGAAYPNFEPNEELYIFASDEIVPTNEISTNTIAFEKVNVAPRDGSFRGIYFNLDEEQDLYLGFQTDFSGCQTNNLRAKAVKLLYYGTINYESVMTLVASIEEKLEGIKVNENTGFYSQDAVDKLKEILAEAKKLDKDADFETVSTTYNNLNTAYNDFIENGKNPGGQPIKIDATDITKEYLVESSAFSRLDPSVTTRFSTPKNWTVENFLIEKGGEGIKNGVDNYPGYECLSLGIWDDRQNNEEGDIADARLYRIVNLPAGTYYFGATYNTTYNMSPKAYIFASDATMSTSEITENSIAYYPISKASDNDELYHGIYFTIDKQQDVVLGFQANLAEGSATQEFRAKGIVLYGYGYVDAIEEVAHDTEYVGEPRFYTISGVRLQQAPQHGFFIVRQGGKTYKAYRK